MRAKKKAGRYESKSKFKGARPKGGRYKSECKEVRGVLRLAAENAARLRMTAV